MNPAKLKTNLTRAIQFFQNGDISASKDLINKINQHNDKIALCWFLLGAMSIQENAFNEAIKQLTKATKLQTIYPDAYNNLGVAYERLNQLTEAKSAYQKALEQKPDYPQALNNLASIYQHENDLEQAIILYHEAIKYMPDYVNALNSLGLCYLQKHRLSEAEKYLHQAITLAPSDAIILNNLGQLLSSQFQYAQAMECFKRALTITSDMPAVLLNIGLLYEQQNHLDEARNYFLKAAHDPDHKKRAYNNLSMLELSRQNYQEGWSYYQYRQSQSNHITLTKEITIHDLKDKNILIEKDQGLGDEIFFCRFLPFLSAIAKNVVYHTDPRLVSMLSRSMQDITFVSESLPEKNFDLQLPVSELPRIFWNSIPNPTPSSIRISTDKSFLTKVTNSLPNNKNINIAVTWEAGIAGLNTLYKRMDPLTVGKLLRDCSANVLILQRNPNPRDIDLLEKGLQRKAFNFSYINNDLEETLAFLSIIDGYLTVSNTNVHLMAALGKSASIFIPHPPEWRWARSAQSPWFPNFPLYRQDSSGSWEKAFKNCAKDFAALLSN